MTATRIVLIDGVELAKLMIAHGVGVTLWPSAKAGGLGLLHAGVTKIGERSLT